jgi:HK97 family phage major capsid protein
MIITVLAVFCFVALAAGGPMPHGGDLAGNHDFAPFVFLGVVIEEIKTLVEQYGIGFEEFKKRYDVKINDLTKYTEQLEARMNRPTRSIPADGRRHYLSTEARKALDVFARTGDDSGLQRKAGMSSVSLPDGGFLVPEEIDSEIEKLIADLSPMRGVANVKPITGSDYKKVVNKGGTEAGWVGEQQERPDTGHSDLAQISAPPGEVYAQPKITQTLLDDAAFDAAGWLIEEITEAFLIKEGDAFINGTGINKPRGLLTYETAAVVDATRPFGKLEHVVSGSASSVTADAIVKMPFRLKAGYRQGAVWYMNSMTAAVLMTLKDKQDRYLWTDGLRDGQPPSLAGYPVEFDENMPDVTGNAFPIAFGNFKRGYIITDRRETTILRDPFTAKPFVKFYGTKRVGGGVVNFHAIKLMKIST